MPTHAQGRKFDPLTVMRCFNCDDPNHTIKKCPKPIDITKAARKKIEYYSRKTGNSRNAHIVLFQLCNQLDEMLDSPNDANHTCLEDEASPELNEEDLFEALLMCLDKPDDSLNEEAETLFIELPAIINLAWEEANTFHGACFDIRATKSVVGRKQAEEYYKFMGIPLIVKRVEINVPLLVGLDLMDKYKLYIDNVSNMLVCKAPQWSHPVTRKFGHVYYEWTYETMYSEKELRRIHRHFYHPHPERLYSLVHRAGDSNATPETMEMLKNLTASCDVCQRLSETPGRFRVSLPQEAIIFNRTVLLDLMYLDSKTVLHIICRDTMFSSAVFLTNGESTQDIWNAYVRFWVNPYVGYSKVMHTDQRPQFTSEKWKSPLKLAGITQKLSRVESHCALGAGERYYEFLRQVYRKVRAEQSQIPIEDCLSLSISAMNNTAGPNGLTPHYCCLEFYPISSGYSDLPHHRDRMRAMKSARDEWQEL
eukprot:IDg21509t1